MVRGDHIFVDRGIYDHHGIYCGDGTVIHYTGEVGRKANASIKRSSIIEFANGAKIQIRAYGLCNTVEAVMRLAESKLNEKSYDLVFNNCEHFATWCKTGSKKSEQVKDAASTVLGGAGTGATVTGGLGVVSATGIAAGLSGPGIMSGLATAGGIVGGGAVAGVAVLGAAPAAVATVCMRSVLKDSENLSNDEREARKLGRKATVGGAVAGTGASIGAIAAAGTTAGLSGAGIASGLAAVGSVVGGGMAAGVAVTVAAPAVAAASVGYGAYKLWKWIKK